MLLFVGNDITETSKITTLPNEVQNSYPSAE